MTLVGIDVSSSLFQAAVFQKDIIKVVANVSNDIIEGDVKNMRSLYQLKYLNKHGNELFEPIDNDLITYDEFINQCCNIDEKCTSKHLNKMDRTVVSETIANVLKLIKLKIDEYCDSSVKDVVLAVPACSKFLLRKVLSRACNLAGLNVLRFISSPCATALAYNFSAKDNDDDEFNVIALHIGKKTLNVGVCSVEDGLIEVKSLQCESLGDQLDNILSEYFMELHKDKIPTRCIPDLKLTCKKITHKLLSLSVATEKFVFNDHALNLTISKLKFEELTENLFNKCLKLIDKCLLKAGMQQSNIHKVLISQSSIVQLPNLKSQLKLSFPDVNTSDVKFYIVKDSVVFGAAIQHAILTSYKSKRISQMLLVDITSLNIGVRTNENLVHSIILDNWNLPAAGKLVVSTTQDNQTYACIDVYEGNNKEIAKNYFLGQFIIQGIGYAPRGIPRIIVSMDVENNGDIFVKVTDTETEKTNSLKISAFNNDDSESTGQMIMNGDITVYAPAELTDDEKRKAMKK